MTSPTRSRRLLLPLVSASMALLIGPLTGAGAGACEKHLDGHQQGADTNQEGARR